VRRASSPINLRSFRGSSQRIASPTQCQPWHGVRMLGIRSAQGAGPCGVDAGRLGGWFEGGILGQPPKSCASGSDGLRSLAQMSPRH